MAIYEIKITGTLLINAENVVQAKRVAKRAKLIGQHVGSHRPGHDRDMISHELKIKDFEQGTPKRVRTPS